MIGSDGRNSSAKPVAIAHPAVRSHCTPGGGTYNLGGCTRSTDCFGLAIVKTLLVTILAVGLSWLSLGCGSLRQNVSAGFQNENPAARIAAVALAGRTKDQAAVPFLIDRLTDTEQDVRFFTIIALKQITGKTMGWNYYDPSAERDQAVGRWRQWLQSERRGLSGSAATATKPDLGLRTQEADKK